MTTNRPDINLQIIPMPVHGAHTRNEDGSHTVFVNANDTFEQRMKSYRHELDHIDHNDLDKKDASVEVRAHGRE